MDLNKTYNNKKLESRRQKLVAAAMAETKMRAAKCRTVKPRAEVLAAFDASVISGALRAAIVATPVFRRATGSLRAACRELLLTVAERSSLLDRDAFSTYLPALARLVNARHAWIRDPKSWRPGTYNQRRQFSSLARHLLARYVVPGFFDEVWFEADAASRQSWFIHVGQGSNLRSAFGLPLELTKKMAHHVMDAPADVTLTQAIRFGQCKGLDVPERTALAILGSRLGQSFCIDDVEAFWTTVLRFFARYPMIDPNQVGPIVDYLHHQRFVRGPGALVNGVLIPGEPPQPRLTMRDRDPHALVTQVQTWHRQLGRRPKSSDFTWVSCGISGYQRLEGEGSTKRLFQVVELLDSTALRDEGKTMHHCVATYAWSCRSGSTAIYSMRVVDSKGERRLLTLEVNVRLRQIVQARGRFNAAATPLDQRVMLAWCTAAGLSVGRYALPRG